MKRIFFVILALWFYSAAPAEAQLNSDYLNAEAKKLPQKTYDLMQKGQKERTYGDRTAGGKRKVHGKKRTKKERRAARHKRAQEKKAEKLFGTFNQ